MNYLYFFIVGAIVAFITFITVCTIGAVVSSI